MFTTTTFRRQFVLPLCGALALGALAPAGGGLTRAHAASTARSHGTDAAFQCAATPLGAATTFNVFILGDATQQNADTQGRLAVGGNATLTNYDVGLTLGGPVGAALVVGGNLTYTNGAVHDGDATYGGTLAQTFVAFPQGGTFRQETPLDFAAAGSQLRTLSSYYATLPANGTTTVRNGVITLTGTDPRLDVFSVSGDAVAGASGLAIDAPAGATVLVNVSGSAVTLANGGFDNLTGVTSAHVLFNFAQATSLTLSNVDVGGSILAPSAAITFLPSLVTGALVGASLSSGGQANSGQANTTPFTGCLPVAGGPPAGGPGAATPELGSGELLATGLLPLGLLALYRRRRARRGAKRGEPATA